MKMRSLLIASALIAVATAASAATFDWTPVISQPNPSLDVTQTYQLSTLILNCYETGVANTDVMPKWIDEEGNEIVATSGEQDPWSWDASEFYYYFDASSFKSNGEYILEFPEGMLVNPAGDVSAKVQTPYTFNVAELAGAMFEDFEVVSLSPDLSEPQAIWSDQTVTISTNHNDAIGLTVLRINDKSEDGEFVLESTNFTAGREPGSNSEISWTVAGDYKFFEGHTYVAEFVFYNGKDQFGSMGETTPIVDRVSYEFTGKVEGFKYSSVKLESVTPDPFFTVISTPEQAVFKYVFSGPVNVYKAVTPKGQFGVIEYPESCLSANEDKTEWTLDLSSNEEIRELDAELVIQIYARDSDGNQLKGNEGSEADACYQYSWECELGAIAINVVTPAANAELDRLTEVVVKSSNGATMEWSWTGMATIESMTREVMGILVYEYSEESSDEIKFTKWTNAYGIEEPIDLTEAGPYRLVFSHGCFVFGEQFDSKVSHSVTSDFSITGNASDPGTDPSDKETLNYSEISIVPGSTVASLQEIYMIFPEEIGLLGYYADVYNTTNADADPVLVGRADITDDWDDWKRVNITLQQPVTEAGTYEIRISKSTIGTIAYCESNGAQGTCNPDLCLQYTVDPSGSAVGTVNTAASHDVYDMHGRIVMRSASKENISKLPKGIYIINGKKLVVK